MAVLAPDTKTNPENSSKIEAEKKFSAIVKTHESDLYVNIKTGVGIMIKASHANFENNQTRLAERVFFIENIDSGKAKQMNDLGMSGQGKEYQHFSFAGGESLIQTGHLTKFRDSKGNEMMFTRASKQETEAFNAKCEYSPFPAMPEAIFVGKSKDGIYVVATKDLLNPQENVKGYVGTKGNMREVTYLGDLNFMHVEKDIKTSDGKFHFTDPYRDEHPNNYYKDLNGRKHKLEITEGIPAGNLAKELGMDIKERLDAPKFSLPVGSKVATLGDVNLHESVTPKVKREFEQARPFLAALDAPPRGLIEATENPAYRLRPTHDTMFTKTSDGKIYYKELSSDDGTWSDISSGKIVDTGVALKY